MIINLTSKGLKLSPRFLGLIEKDIKKLNKYLPYLNSDLKLNVFIKKSHSKLQLKSKYKNHKDYLASKLKQVSFEGWMRLVLPKKALYTHLEGITIQDFINHAKKNLLKEIKKYKDLHFKAQSQYPCHKSIRRGYDT